jgi:hypothetical protein
VVDDKEVIRIAVRASMAAIGAVLACILTLFLFAAAVSPRINVPGIHVSRHGVVNPPAGD